MNLPPNEFVKVTDNAEAQLLMLQLGILDAVLKAEKAQQAKALKQSGTTVLDHNHPTHWIIAETYVAPLGPTNGNGREPVPELCTLPVHVDLDWLNTGGSHGLKHDIELPQLRRILEKLLDEPTVESITTTKRP